MLIVFPSVIFDTTYASLLRNWSVSFAVAAIAIWIMAIHDVFAWLTKVFVNPQRAK